ncbi:hypothetical protein BFV94_3547 [Alteromonas macleodii]|jgi:hypothetical protein|uniref:Uncharacterized protein n=1 Tax=Alteromonas macleodii TaxID=28108 RepID=A0AB36FMY7_ALTMA|nr:hypothetical protein BFV93_3537 [Alteromonas macleodii]OES28075.1 hypothetical protein BFV94_3547 [Alteromonas macleodii]OES28107.1 hypothetical protein BFV95_3547 [Alteromonas macleodii]OES39921.1 hypothetical protein BFV96_3530 [Alteromonas macleodii]
MAEPKSLFFYLLRTTLRHKGLIVTVRGQSSYGHLWLIKVNTP